MEKSTASFYSKQWWGTKSSDILVYWDCPRWFYWNQGFVPDLVECWDMSLTSCLAYLTPHLYYHCAELLHSYIFFGHSGICYSPYSLWLCLIWKWPLFLRTCLHCAAPSMQGTPITLRKECNWSWRTLHRVAALSPLHYVAARASPVDIAYASHSGRVLSWQEMCSAIDWASSPHPLNQCHGIDGCSVDGAAQRRQAHIQQLRGIKEKVCVCEGMGCCTTLGSREQLLQERPLGPVTESIISKSRSSHQLERRACEED